MGLSTWAGRPDRRPARRRLGGRPGAWSPDVDALGAVPSRPFRSNRADEREAASRRPRGWIGWIEHEVLPENERDHLVLDDLGPDIPPEGRRVRLAPILVHDVEVDGVAGDEDVLHRPDRVGVVAAAAHHAPQPVADQEKGEDLLVHAQRAERGGNPGADDIRGPQRLEWSGL